MNKTNQNKLESLAIDALTQFKAGVNNVRIGNRIINAQETFNIARMSIFDEIKGDDNKVIIALMSKLENNFARHQLDSLSVEVVA